MERVTDGMNRIGISITKPVLLAVGLLLVGWLFNTPGGLLGKADAVGYAVCHRIDLRSFYIGDRQLPLCARCTGMYLGAMLGLVYQVFFGRRRAGLQRFGGSFHDPVSRGFGGLPAGSGHPAVFDRTAG